MAPIWTSAVVSYAIDAPLLTSIGSVLVALIAAGAAIASQRAAANAAVKNTDTTSRAAIEAEAFERAKTYYEGVISDQDRRIAARDIRVGELEHKVDDLEEKLDGQEREVKSLRAELDTAKNALRLAFPDEH